MLRRRGRSDRPTKLTPREQQVLALVRRGLENKEIAASLKIAEQSVKAHVSALLQKFGVPNRAALAELSTRLSLIGNTRLGAGLDPDWIPQVFGQAELQICVMRGPDLRYEAANEAFMRAIGNRPLIGRTMREMFPELEGQDVFERVERVYATGEPDIWHERTTQWDHGDGIKPGVLDVVIQPLRDESGAVNGVISYVLEVTDLVRKRKNAQQPAPENRGRSTVSQT